VGRLKRELELLRGAAGGGELDYERIAGALEEEFDSRGRRSRLAEADGVGEPPAENHDDDGADGGLQARYRRLSERLHPDLRFDQDATSGTCGNGCARVTRRETRRNWRQSSCWWKTCRRGRWRRARWVRSRARDAAEEGERADDQ